MLTWYLFSVATASHLGRSLSTWSLFFSSVARQLEQSVLPVDSHHDSLWLALFCLMSDSQLHTCLIARSLTAMGTSWEALVEWMHVYVRKEAWEVDSCLEMSLTEKRAKLYGCSRSDPTSL